MKIKKQTWLLSFLLIIIIIITCHNIFLSPSKQTTLLISPNWNHWFGTDINGNDVFIRTLGAFGYELLNLVSVLFLVWILGLLLGSLVSQIGGQAFKAFFLNLVHYMATLPVLLIALFLLILFGGGFFNAVIILSITIIPTQILFVYNQLETAQNESFVVAKKSYGLSNTAIYKSHLIPFILKKYNSYTLSRIPEIIMMNLALNFLGLGIQEPHPSLGRMLFDGLSFMFSAWWLWISPVILIFLLFLIVISINHGKAYD